MFRLIRLFFTLFGIVSFFFWLGLGYGWMTDAYGVKTGTMAIIKIFKTVSTVEDGQSTDSIITAEQQAVLDSVGIESDSIPTSLTLEQQQCMREKIGEERVDAIVAGATPSPREVLVGASCL